MATPQRKRQRAEVPAAPALAAALAALAAPAEARVAGAKASARSANVAAKAAAARTETAPEALTWTPALIAAATLAVPKALPPPPPPGAAGRRRGAAVGRGRALVSGAQPMLSAFFLSASSNDATCNAPHSRQPSQPSGSGQAQQAGPARPGADGGLPAPPSPAQPADPPRVDDFPAGASATEEASQAMPQARARSGDPDGHYSALCSINKQRWDCNIGAVARTATWNIKKSRNSYKAIVWTATFEPLGHRFRYLSGAGLHMDIL